MKAKSLLRESLIAKRRALDSITRYAAKEAALQYLLTSEIFQASQHIACYWALDHEFDCALIIEKIWGLQKQCYLPVLSLTEKSLHFVSYEASDVLQSNRYRIYEPVNTQPMATEDLDLVIVPMVGFDLKGHRLGMGGGYYDRTFSIFHKNLRKKVYLMGLAYECQQVDELPVESWDVAVDSVLTEKKMYLIT